MKNQADSWQIAAIFRDEPGVSMIDEYSPTVEDERNGVSVGRPHLVILGAGASRAAFPKGDRNGRRLPLMSDFVDTLDLRPLLKSWNLSADENFEDIFSDIYASGDFDRIKMLQDRVEEYFGALEITEEPTIYDHLLVGLRKNDFIASFNWDPLLVQAYQRSSYGVGLPRLVFLHGNVASGYCSRDRTVGSSGARCSKCGETFTRTPLLYPIKRKDYAADKFIAAEWNLFKKVLRHTFMVTIFGYSGPKSDEEALAAMSEAWGPAHDRELEQTCFITVQDRNELLRNFENFVHSHHFEIHADFYSSWIARHPRRTGEAWWNQYLECKFLPENPIPKSANFRELSNWLHPFKEPERSFETRNALTTKP